MTERTKKSLRLFAKSLRVQADKVYTYRPAGNLHIWKWQHSLETHFVIGMKPAVSWWIILAQTDMTEGSLYETKCYLYLVQVF